MQAESHSSKTEEEYNVITQGSLHKAMWKLALPAMISMIAAILFEIADSYWIANAYDNAKLNTATVAGFGAASFLLWCLYSIFNMLSASTVAMISQSKGAKNPKAIAHWTFMSIILAAFSGIFILVAGKLSTPYVLDFMEISPLARESAKSYLDVIFYCAPLLTFTIAADSTFRGDGDALRPMIVMIIANVINAALDPFLINGYWIFPKLGVAGAAWATFVAEIGAVTAFIILFVKRKYKIKYNPRIRFFPSIYRLLKIGLPVASIGFGFSIIYLFLTKIITQFGDAPLASITLAHRIEGLAFFLSHGIAAAVSTLVGQNIGARHFHRAKQSFKLCLNYTNFINLIFTLAFFFGASYLYDLFNQADNVIYEGTQYLMIIAVFEIFMGWEIVAGAAFSGAGNTLPTLVISLPLSILRIPLAYILAIYMQMGVIGIWWAISVSTLLKGIILVFWWSRDRWISHAKDNLKLIEADKSQRMPILK